MASLLSLPAKPYPAKCRRLPEFRAPALVSLEGFGSRLVHLGKRRSLVVRGLTVNSDEKARVSVEKREGSQKSNSRPIVVIDNYDSFTYNLCQVRARGLATPIDRRSLTSTHNTHKNTPVRIETLAPKLVFCSVEIYRSYHPRPNLKGFTEICPLQYFPVAYILTKYFVLKYMGELGANFEVYRNDEITVQEVKGKNPSGILVSPGPGAPQDSGISLQTVTELGPSIPLFGVCMGLQCIGEAFGGNIVRAPSGIVHGKSTLVFYDENQEDNLFHGLPNPFIAGRYHSLVIENETFPSDVLELTAWTEDGLIMAARHKKYKHILGVQFHPESIITKEGKIMIANFLKLIEKFEGTQN